MLGDIRLHLVAKVASELLIELLLTLRRSNTFTIMRVMKMMSDDATMNKNM